MVVNSKQSWPLTGTILLSVCHSAIGLAAFLIGGSLAHNAIQMHLFHPDLWVALLTCVMGFYAFATTMSIWNDSQPISWGIGIAITIAGLGTLLGTCWAYLSLSEQSRVATGTVGGVISTGMILTGVSMIWWNEKHATIYCRHRMHLFGAFLDLCVMLGLLWVIEPWNARSLMELSASPLVVCIGIQILWLVVLLLAVRRFPKQPKDEAVKTTCYRT